MPSALILSWVVFQEKGEASRMKGMWVVSSASQCRSLREPRGRFCQAKQLCALSSSHTDLEVQNGFLQMLHSTMSTRKGGRKEARDGGQAECILIQSFPR